MRRAEHNRLRFGTRPFYALSDVAQPTGPVNTNPCGGNHGHSPTGPTSLSDVANPLAFQRNTNEPLPRQFHPSDNLTLHWAGLSATPSPHPTSSKRCTPPIAHVCKLEVIAMTMTHELFQQIVKTCKESKVNERYRASLQGDMTRIHLALGGEMVCEEILRSLLFETERQHRLNEFAELSRRKRVLRQQQRQIDKHTTNPTPDREREKEAHVHNCQF